jgi:hypothetical protein
MPGYPDFFGTPLVHGLKFLAGPNATLAVPANSTSTFNVLCSHPGYFIDIFATIASGAATVPFYKVMFTWQDSDGIAIIDEQSYYLAASSTGPWRTCGKGPTRGQLLTVTITNYDPAFALTVNYTIGETTQHIARDDWRTVDYQTASVPKYGIFGHIPTGLAKGDMAAGLLMTETNDTIPAGTSWAFLLPMYTGLVFWQFLANANIAVSVRIPTELSAAPFIDGNAPIWLDLTLTDVTVQLAHPRIPLVVNLQNTSGAGIAGVSAMAVMVENAS